MTILLNSNKAAVALIGNGYFGSVLKKYIPAYFDLKYIANSQYNLEEIWNDPTVIAVIIATPIETHYTIVKAALLNNKHVLVEKPVTTKYQEAVELQQMAKARKLHLCVEYTQTFSPSIKKCVDTILNNNELQYMEMSVKHLGRFMQADVYWLLASHQLSILNMLCPLQKLEFENEDHMFHKELCTTGSIKFKHSEKSFAGRIDVSTNFPEKEMLINFYMRNMTVKYNPLSKHSVSITRYNKKFKVLPSGLIEREEHIHFDEKNNLKFAMEYFCDVINNKASANIDSAAQITKILEDFATIKE